MLGVVWTTINQDYILRRNKLVFDPGMLFQPSLNICGQGQEPTPKGASLREAPALLANIN